MQFCNMGVWILMNSKVSGLFFLGLFFKGVCQITEVALELHLLKAIAIGDEGAPSSNNEEKQ